MKYAERTNVPALKSRLEIETTVRRYGADQFAHAEADDRAMIQFRLTKPRKLMVRFVLPLKRKYTGYDGKERFESLPEQQSRQRWRALLLCIKAKLEAVETGIEAIEHAFLAEIVLPDGRTLGEWAAPQVVTMLESGTMPKQLPYFEEQSR